MWGEGTLASSDAMSLEASRYLWNARVDPGGGPTPSGSIRTSSINGASSTTATRVASAPSGCGDRRGGTTDGGSQCGTARR